MERTCMTDRDNVLLVHWHDLGRYLGVYGHPDVSSPRLDQLAAEGILFTATHATAPLCSPFRRNGRPTTAHEGCTLQKGRASRE